MARPIFGADGQCILNCGVEIKPYFIKHLRNMDVGYLYVYDDRLEGVAVRDVVSEETRQEAGLIVRELVSFDNDTGRKSIRNICKIEGQLVRSVTRIVDELLQNKDLVVNLVDIRSSDNYTFSHSVNVCVLSTLMAIKLNYSRQKINKVALGSVLHDLGKIMIPEKILKKPGFLTEEEFNLVKKHPYDGFELFKHNPLYSEVAGDIIAQHHERYNGTGYPHGLKGDEINPLAQIVSIADIYDALTSDRPYRRAYNPHEAIELFTVSESSHNIEFLRVFLSFIAAYPVGTIVRLSNYEAGMVTDNIPGYPLRPVVRVLYDCDGGALRPHQAPYEIDLTEKLDVVVSGIVFEDPNNKN